MLSRFAIALFVSATLLFAGQPMVARMTVLPIAVDESLVQSLTARSRSLGPPRRGVADAIELVIAPAAGVEVVRLLGGEAMCSGRDGLTIPLPDMVHGTRPLVVAELRLKAPGDQPLLLELGQLRLSSRRPGSAEVATSTEQVSGEIAAREPDVVVDAIRRVMLVRADRGREAARALADRGQFGGAAALLRGLLAEIAQIPSFVVAEDSPLGEAHALLLDEAMAMDRNPDEGAYKMFRKSAMASKLAMHAPPAASSRGAASTKLIELAAGDYPEAFLVVLTGPGAGKRHLLAEECVIGRTASADLPIESDSVSRRHAEIYALEGEFWACDLGSTNVTMVNGKPLGSTPMKLRAGDRLQVGDVELRYEEEPT